MRKFSLLVITVFASMVMFAQNGKNITAFNSYMAYLNSGGAEKEQLKTGLEASQEAAQHEDTKDDAKTWYYKGYIEQLIYQDEQLTSQYPGIILESATSYKKALELANAPDAKKFRFKDEAARNLGITAGQLHNYGIALYDSKDLLGAYNTFNKALESADYLKANGLEGDLQLNADNSRFLAAICAEQLGKKDEAEKLYKQLIENKYDNVYIYKGLANMYSAKEDWDGAMAILDQGSKAYPADASLTIDMINIYLQTGREAEGVEVMLKAIEQEPDNAQLYFVLANTYGKLGNEEKTLEYYNKAIEVDPTYADSYNNLGAYYLEKANVIVEKMNDPSVKDAEYQKLDAERKALLEQALPYLEKANELKPDNLEILDVLKTIYAKLGQYDKSKQIKEQMLKIQQG